MSHAGEAWFRLALSPSASSIACTNAGVFVGEVPLLKRHCSSRPGGGWGPRALSELNAELSERFGLPVDFARKMEGLSVVARALGEGNLARAQVATLNLQIPDPPDLRKTEASAQETINLAVRLQASQLLKADWDPTQHPRWPAGSPDGVGGQFAPVGSAVTSSPDSVAIVSANSRDTNVGTPSDDGSLIPVQLDIPLDPVFPGPFGPVIPNVPKLGPFPSEVMPPPIAIPNAFPRELPINPYPDRPECEEEWAAATKYCFGLVNRGLLGKDGHRGFGKSLSQCIMGQVSQECGGNVIQS
ncbi:MAG TPA: hypothetical protein VMF67_17490 [Rhizomicrobium sp.]|nr:hypothetical protein [Rhizomicrobium sp.]